jgi:hypothetical protein
LDHFCYVISVAVFTGKGEKGKVYPRISHEHRDRKYIHIALLFNPGSRWMRVAKARPRPIYAMKGSKCPLHKRPDGPQS